ncbi:hypothetical protein FRC03_012370 [Tulasnella sp. 419]|nr:hypothetical protein FRC03_012370 [Tulasnella sp. 419]
MSGEIKHFYPNTNVTLVQSAQALLNDTYPMKFRTYTLNALQGVGVNVILDDKVDIPQEPYSSVTTHKGKTLKADLVIPTRGGRLNTDFIRSLDPSIVTERGTVKVLSTLQVPLSNGKTNVFAIGDIIEWKEQKQVAKISTHSSVLIANLLSAIKGSKGTKEYKGFMEGIAMPFGPDKGVGYVPLLWGITLGNWATKTLKGKGLFIDLTRKSLNY